MSKEASVGGSQALQRTSRVRPTRIERALDWAAGLAPSPIRIATSCCGMSLSQGGDPFETVGTGPPVVSSRSADLLIVAGPITPRQVPMIRAIYERMLEPRWVIAWGACAISGGAYDTYATVAGLGRVIPVDVVVPGCPPSPASLRAALECLRSGDLRRFGAASGHESRGDEEWPIRRESSAPGAAEEQLADPRRGAAREPDRTGPSASGGIGEEAEEHFEGNQNVDHG